jgi:hypothetical protein
MHGCVVSVFVVMTQIYMMSVMVTVVVSVVVAVVVSVVVTVIMSVMVMAVVVSVAEVVVVVVSAGVMKVVLLGDLFSVGSHVFATHRHKLARSIVGRTVRSDDKRRD